MLFRRRGEKKQIGFTRSRKLGKPITVRMGGETVRLKASPGKRRKGRGRKPFSLSPAKFFMPTLKLKSKTRVSTKIKKVYDKKVINPYQRFPASPDLSAEAKAELAKCFALYDPVMLQRKVHSEISECS